MSEQKKRDAKSLVGSILASTQKPSAPTLPDDSPLAAEAEAAGLGRMVAQTANDAAAQDGATAEAPQTAPQTPEEATREATELIEVYFQLEEPIERDLAFERITALDVPIVTEFLRAMMEEDEDEYVRSAAAVELAKRGSAEAVALLEADLQDPEEPFFFSQAVQALSLVRGASFYDTLRSIWHDNERDAEQRREAMLGLEGLDTERALADFAAFIDGQAEIESMADDQVEVAMLAFARNGYKAAAGPLGNLKERVLKTDLDPEEREELAAFLQEGIDLLADDT